MIETRAAVSEPVEASVPADGRVARWALPLAIALLAAWWIYRLTAHGIGVGSDSTVYFAGAESLAEGRGFVWLAGDGLPRPINHYPPFYSAVLSLGLRFLSSPADAARFLEVFLMGVNVVLVAALIGLLTSSGRAAILGALLFAVSEETLTIHSWAMSDGLYLFLVLACTTASTHYWKHGGNRWNRVLMWGTAGLGFLTRYVGLALFLIPLAVTLFRPPREKRRWREAAIGLTLAALPGVIWLVRNAVRTGSATNRQTGFFPQGASWWLEIGRVTETWILPGRILHWLEAARVPPGALLVAALLAGAAVALVVGRGRLQPILANQVWLPVVTMIAAHMGTIALSRWTSYPGPDINTRTLGPVFAGSVVLGAAAIGWVWASGSRPLRTGIVLAALALLVFKAYGARDVVARLLSDGQGYTTTAWSRSSTVAALKRLQPAVVYANDIGVVYYFTGEFANAIPLRYDPITGQERAEYPAEYCRMRHRLREGQGVVVFFGTVTPPSEAASPEDITRHLAPIHIGRDGEIYADGGGPIPECDRSAVSARSEVRFES